MHQTIKDIDLYRGEKRKVVERMKSDFEKLSNTDEHHSRWTLESFCNMCDWITKQDFGAGWDIFKAFPFDDKVGNGLCVVLKKNEV